MKQQSDATDSLLIGLYKYMTNVKTETTFTKSNAVEIIYHQPSHGLVAKPPFPLVRPPCSLRIPSFWIPCHTPIAHAGNGPPFQWFYT